MTDTCPQCGAILDPGTSCQSNFDAMLALEFANPLYGKVHFLTVACFMIQHGQYSDPALAWIAEKIHQFLDEGVSPGQIRRMAAESANQNARAWKVLRGPDAPPLPGIAWSYTLADVAAHLQDPQDYCASVRQWAAVTLREMQPWLVTGGGPPIGNEGHPG